MLTVFINLLLTIHVIVSLLIILLVLMQRPKSEGLGAAFGGGMTENLFGAQTTNVLQNVTRWLGGIFFLLTLVLAMLYSKQSVAKSAVHEKLMAVPAVSATPSATPAALPSASVAPGAPAASPEAKQSPSAAPVQKKDASP